VSTRKDLGIPAGATAFDVVGVDWVWSVSTGV